MREQKERERKRKWGNRKRESILRSFISLLLFSHSGGLCGRTVNSTVVITGSRRRRAGLKVSKGTRGLQD